MEINHYIALLSYTLPAIVTGTVAYHFFNIHTKNEEGRSRFLLNKEAQKNALPLRLQAFERMTLYMERINPSKLLVRIAPVSTYKKEYENFVIAQIEQEFEHNLTQQIYMSEDCWNIIITAKNATIQMIRKACTNDEITNADELRAFILKETIEKQSPSSTALAHIKNEVALLF
jgi:hypothetical protein